MCDIDKIDKRYGKCDSSEVAVYVLWKNRRLALCMKHWKKLANSRREW